MRTAAVPLTGGSVRVGLVELGVDFRTGPKEFVTYCIFHEDRKDSRPNLYINHQKMPGTFHCFKCNASGSFDEFVSKYTHWGPIRVAEFMARHRHAAGELIFDAPWKVKPIKKEELKQYDYRHPYLYERKLEEWVLRKYRVGYDKDEAAITLPWYDDHGKLVAIKRRSVGVKQNMMSGKIDTLYGAQFIRPKKIVWLVEGEFDALYMAQVFRNHHYDEEHAVGGLGGTYLRRGAVELLCKKSPRAVVLALDNDEGGIEASQTIYKTLRQMMIDVVFAEYKADDPNDMTPQQVVTCIKQAQQLIEEMK